ncbi:MAG: DapH/DapD/GlmU-related protein [Bacteroidota bacterium]
MADPAYRASSAQLGPDVQLGVGCVIAERVQIGARCQIGHHVVLHPGSVVEAGVRIDDHAVIGKQPMRAAASATTQAATLDPAWIGEGSLIGAHAVVYAGCTLGPQVLVADHATVREDVVVGARTIIGRGVAVEQACRIGAHCKLETNAYLTAFSLLEDHVFLAPGVLTSNDAYLGRTEARLTRFKGITIRRGGRVGVGAVLLPGLEVGPDAVIGAGAVLTRDAEARMVYLGVPARPVRPVPNEQWLR